MSNSKQHPIKAIINFRKMAADAVVIAAPTLKAATDALVAANAAAVDGGKKAVQEQKHLKEVVVKFLTQLAHWAEANCKEDMTTFLSSGFQAASATKPKAPPVTESIRKVRVIVAKLADSVGIVSNFWFQTTICERFQSQNRAKFFVSNRLH